MIIDLIDKLISHSIDLVHETEKRNRDVFNDFIDPLYRSFEDVHKDYVDTFNKAHKLLSSNSLIEDGELALLLQDDSLFTMTNRVKLNSLVKAKKPKIIKDFIESIENYLNEPFYFVYGGLGNEIDKYIEEGKFEKVPGYFLSNHARSSLWHRIRTNYQALPLKIKKEKWIETIEQFLQELQERYAIVVFEYGKLKNDLLNNEL